MPESTCQCCAAVADDSVDLAVVDGIVARLGRSADRTIPLLQAIQRHYSYLPPAALEHLAAITDIPAARLAGVSSFYSSFRLTPAGRHRIRVCVGTACHVKGAPGLISSLRRLLGIAENDDTDAERRFTVEGVACLGCCTLAPVMLIGDVTYGRLTPETVEAAVLDFLDREKSAQARRGDQATAERATGVELPEIRLGLDSCCLAAGTGDLLRQVEELLAVTGIQARIKRVGCVGMCHRTPMIEIVLPGHEPIIYANLDAAALPRIIHRHFRPPRLATRLRGWAAAAGERLFTNRQPPAPESFALDVRDPAVGQFWGPQRLLALEQLGRLDPHEIDDYLGHDGFQAASSCLVEQTPAAVVELIVQSGLRGRGGAGFPTGRKWEMVRTAAGERKMVVLNGDEGDPGAFMDRMLLESFPFRVIEGLLIAAYAVGAHEGVLYIREEYPLALRSIRQAIDICRRRGYLGERVMGSDFAFELTIQEGAGAFVCGEETALIASIEGRRGTPRLRPPYPAQSGLWGLPTLINNVETIANVPWIVRHGAAAFAAIGTAASPGTKVFSLAGKVVRGGLIEVPMGIGVDRVVAEIGGGVAAGRTFKAVQIGGPSGGCLPASLAATPIDFEALRQHGAIMGSGGLVVLDDQDCMVDIARYFLAFTQDQSCGRCTPCRVGTRRMLDILERLCAGTGRADDLERLEQLGTMIQRTSLCGLGQTAPNPVLSTLRHFRAEYQAHLEGRCPAGKCVDLIVFTVGDECIGCTKCAQACPVDAIASTPYQKHQIDSGTCIRCGACRTICPVQAISVQ